MVELTSSQAVCIRSFNRILQSKSIHIMPRGHIETDPSTSSYFRISEGFMFDRDSSSVVRSLIGLFALRCNPVSKVYQHRSRKRWNFGSSFWERIVKDTAAGKLTPDPFSQFANGTGPNRTRAQWMFTNVYQHR